VQEYERAVIFRLGRIAPGGAKGPGMNAITKERLTVVRKLPAMTTPAQIIQNPHLRFLDSIADYYRSHFSFRSGVWVQRRLT